ncbi:MAG: hypothetical protein GQ470_00565 [Gammaproteobacteria bacterium]|nr:hypothetical protein [Gammaproteobacteria bacterium]
MLKLTSFFIAALLITGCGSLPIPDVYIIDHHTVMEEEASGEWPRLEQRFHDLAVTPGPVDLEKEGNSRRRDRAFSVLNGEMTSSDSDK